MKLKKSITPIVLAIFIIVLTMGSVFADQSSFAGDLYADASPTTVHVNDTVTLTITAKNSGLDDWQNVMIYAPIPEGLQYLSFSIPNKVLQDYDSSTGIWNVNKMRHDEKGNQKSLIITTKVMPEAAGKTLSFTPRFTSLISVAYGNPIDMVTNDMAPIGNTVNIKVLPANNIGPSDGTNMGSGDGTGRGSGNGIITDNITPTAKADNSTNSTVNAETIGMQNTGAPLNYMVLAILAVFSGLILPRRK